VVPGCGTAPRKARNLHCTAHRRAITYCGHPLVRALPVSRLRAWASAIDTTLSAVPARTPADDPDMRRRQRPLAPTINKAQRQLEEMLTRAAEQEAAQAPIALAHGDKREVLKPARTRRAAANTIPAESTLPAHCRAYRAAAWSCVLGVSSTGIHERGTVAPIEAFVGRLQPARVCPALPGVPMPPKPCKPAVEGWFTMDPAKPRLLGTRCAKCDTVYFPKETTFCRNPGCAGTEFAETELSPRGRLWSFTNNCYQPPEPYVSPDPFVPYAVAAVELEAEKMVVLGQVEGASVDELEAGMQMELVLGTLYEDADAEYLVWKWRPA